MYIKIISLQNIIKLPCFLEFTDLDRIALISVMGRPLNNPAAVAVHCKVKMSINSFFLTFVKIIFKSAQRIREIYFDNQL